MRLDLRLDDIRHRIPQIAADIAANISFGLGCLNAENVDHDLFDGPVWNEIALIALLRQMAHDQPGTVGPGNHCVDALEDEGGFIWRALGDAVAAH